MQAEHQTAIGGALQQNCTGQFWNFEQVTVS